jgi:hypothetical protein
MLFFAPARSHPGAASTCAKDFLDLIALPDRKESGARDAGALAAFHRASAFAYAIPAAQEPESRFRRYRPGAANRTHVCESRSDGRRRPKPESARKDLPDVIVIDANCRGAKNYFSSG